jgi:hypothetical protein
MLQPATLLFRFSLDRNEKKFGPDILRDQLIRLALRLREAISNDSSIIFN